MTPNPMRAPSRRPCSCRGRDSALAAQRGRRALQPPPADTTKPATKKIDTSLVRKTPDGFVLDFQEQELRVVLGGDRRGGRPERHVRQPALHEGHVAHGTAGDEGRGTRRAARRRRGERAEDDGGAVAHPDRGNPARDAAAAGAAAGGQAQLKLFTYRLKHASAVTLAPGPDEPAHRVRREARLKGRYCAERVRQRRRRRARRWWRGRRRRRRRGGAGRRGGVGGALAAAAARRPGWRADRRVSAAAARRRRVLAQALQQAFGSAGEQRR